MFDFLLVLGQIPGTSFQLTFNELLFVLNLLLILALCLSYKNSRKPMFKLSGFILPVISTRPKHGVPQAKIASLYLSQRWPIIR